MKIVDIKITKKTGTREEGYRYEGKITLSEDYSCWKKYLLFFKRYKKEKIESTYNFIVDGLFLKIGSMIVYDRYSMPFNSEYDTAISEIISKGISMKSEDECCLDPDLAEGHWYYKYDILLGYLLNRDDIEVVDYGLLDSIWSIKFKYGKHKFTYDNHYLIKYGYPNKIYQKACLNCKTCDNSEEENFIKEFDKWLEDEYNKKQREEMAKNICCDTYLFAGEDDKITGVNQMLDIETGGKMFKTIFPDMFLRR